MQQIRGFVYFEDKSFEDVFSGFKNFSLDNTRFEFFKSVFRHDKHIFLSGVFITGKVNDEYSSVDIVNLFRQYIGLKEELRNCDISIENEDVIKLIKDGDLKGNYIGIRINPHYELEKIYSLSSKIGDLTNAQNILVRTVESVDNKPLVCIDLITRNDFKKYRNEIKKILNSQKLSLGKYTFISLG